MSRRRTARLSAAAIAVVGGLVATATPAAAAPTFTAASVRASVQSTTVTASAVIKSSTRITAEYAGVCSRSSAGTNVDFPLRTRVALTSSGTQVSGTRTFSAGTYTYWPCARVAGRWYDVGAKSIFTVGSSTTPPPSPVPAPAPARSAMTGVAIPTWVLNTTDAQLGQRLDLIAGTGVGWIRLDVAASELEARQGTTNWPALDRVIRAADARGLRILGLVNTLPAWSRPAGTAWNYGPTTTAQRAAYADFARRAAERYRGVVDAWELWNEPNLDQFWAPTPSVAAYGALIREAYPVVKAADPGVPVIAGGTGWSGGAPDVPSNSWYSQLYAQGNRTSFDAVNVHPYQDIGWARGGQLFTGGEMGPVASIRATMNAYGDGAKAIWGTEAGFPTAGGGNVTEQEQAKWLAPTFSGWIDQTTSRGRTGPLFYYTLLDYGPSREGSFGLVRTDGTAKPAYAALKAWASSTV